MMLAHVQSPRRMHADVCIHRAPAGCATCPTGRRCGWTRACWQPRASGRATPSGGSCGSCARALPSCASMPKCRLPKATPPKSYRCAAGGSACQLQRCHAGRALAVCLMHDGQVSDAVHCRHTGATRRPGSACIPWTVHCCGQPSGAQPLIVWCMAAIHETHNSMGAGMIGWQLTAVSAPESFTGALLTVLSAAAAAAAAMLGIPRS